MKITFESGNLTLRNETTDKVTLHLENVSMYTVVYGRGIIVGRNKKYGLYSFDGKQLIPMEYTFMNVSGNKVEASNQNILHIYSADGKLLEEKKKVK